MWKAVLVGSTALAIAGSSLVYAQQRSGRPETLRWRPNTEDMQAFGEARLAALKAGLALTPEQEKNWPAYETAAREFAKLRIDRIHDFMAAGPEGRRPVGDPAERMRQRANAMTEAGAALKKLADATDPLYKSLDDSQKRRFAVLTRMAHLDGPGFRGRGKFRGRDGREFRGPGDEGPRRFERERRRTEGGPDGFERGPRRSERAAGGQAEEQL